MGLARILGSQRGLGGGSGPGAGRISRRGAIGRTETRAGGWRAAARGGARRDFPHVGGGGDDAVFTRTFQIGPSPEPLTLLVAENDNGRVVMQTSVAVIETGDTVVAATVSGAPITPRCRSLPSQLASPLEISFRDRACASWQNSMATNWSQDPKPLL